MEMQRMLRLKDEAIEHMLADAITLIRQKELSLIEKNAAITGELNGFIYRGRTWSRNGGLAWQFKRLAAELHNEADDVMDLMQQVKDTTQYASTVYSGLVRTHVKSEQDMRNLFPDFKIPDHDVWGLDRTGPQPYAGASQPSGLHHKLYLDAIAKIRYCNGLVILLGGD